MEHSAYTLYEIKADGDGSRIMGMATTPHLDRQGDIVDPKGVQFKNPLPLLFHHDRERPVGTVKFLPATDDGVAFEATFATVDEPGPLRDRIAEARQSVKAGLIRYVSIGWRALENGIELMRDGRAKLKSIEVVELSLVTIPANPHARILSVKELAPAASGQNTPPSAGTFPVVHAQRGAPAMTVQEQITNFEGTLAAKLSQMTDIMTKSEGSTLDAPQKEAYDTLEREVASINEHLPRLRTLQKTLAANATPITPVTDPAAASNLRGAAPVVQVKANVPKGTAFTRFVMAKIIGKNSMSDAIAYAESRQDWKDQTPEVALALKAAVNPGTILEPAWAAPLAVTRPMANEFLDMLRPETLIGKVPGLRNVPFNVSMPVQTGGGTYTWVGEGAPKPVGNLQFASVTLGVTKAAGIIVISEELAKISSPSAEGVIRNDMIRGMAQYLDTQFIDPTIAAVTNVSPASITNLANGFATAGTSADNARTDLKKAITLMTAANYPVSELVFIMSEANAFALAAALTTNGVMTNPNITAKGGSILGVPVVTSQAAGNVVALVHAPSILFADDGGVNIDVSREASVEMNTTPTSPVAAATVLVSLWQQNLIGLRAERFINWKRARTTAVVYTTATYV